MRHGRGWTTITLLALIGLIALAAPASAGPERVRPVYYLALGDSLSKGVQLEDGVATDDGYANQLFAELRAYNPRLELHQLGCEVTETTKTMLRGRERARIAMAPSSRTRSRSCTSIADRSL